MKDNTAALLPENRTAHETAPLYLQYEYFGARSSPAKVMMPDGEVLCGRFWPNRKFNLVRELSSGNLKDLFGSGDYTSIFVKVVGTKTSLQCRGSQKFGHVDAQCQMSNGAAYQLHF